jgi:hypothetical protein
MIVCYRNCNRIENLYAQKGNGDMEATALRSQIKTQELAALRLTSH